MNLPLIGHGDTSYEPAKNYGIETSTNGITVAICVTDTQDI